ncbi:hypothetical protein D9M70_490040 [compost metagenome]
MLGEVQHLDDLGPGYLIAMDETSLGKVIQHFVCICVVVGERFGFDPLRTVLKTAFAISQHPQVDEQQPCERLQFGQVFVGHDSGFDVACASHQSTALSLLVNPRAMSISASPASVTQKLRPSSFRLL